MLNLPQHRPTAAPAATLCCADRPCFARCGRAAQVEERLRFYEEGVAPRKNLDVMKVRRNEDLFPPFTCTVPALSALAGDCVSPAMRMACALSTAARTTCPCRRRCCWDSAATWHMLFS